MSTDLPEPTETPPPPELRRYKLTIAYDGTEFHGWQKQVSGNGGRLRTVAGVVEAALLRVLKQPIDLVGASRTDTGVHARGQVAHFDAAISIPIERLTMAINSRLPRDIDVLGAQVVSPTFHAIRGAVSKQYRYFIHNTTHRPLERRHHVWHCWWDLDIDRMRDAAARLVGTHDFEGFSSAGHGRTTTVRTIHTCDVLRRRDAPQVEIVVAGDGFLYNMVRIIAGTLVEVGRSHLEPHVMDKVLESRNRRDAGPRVPACGLWLEWIAYGSDGATERRSDEATKGFRLDDLGVH